MARRNASSERLGAGEADSRTMRRASRWSRVLLPLALVAACADHAPDPQPVFLNQDFEYATPRGHPRIWYVEADDETTRVALDTTRPHRGERGLRIETNGDEPVIVYTPLLLEDRCVGEIAATAALFTAGASPSAALFYLEPGRSPTIGTAVTCPERQWCELESSLSAKGECLPPSLMIGALVSGRGSVWLDDLRVSTDDPEYVTGGAPPGEPEPAEIAAIEEHAIELTSLDPNTEPADLEPARSLFRGAKIVALGDNSHGARELFRFKYRLIRFLVSEMGFTAFALEMPVEGAEIVHEYVLGAAHEKETVLRALRYPSWQTDEMWSLIEWMRDHNRVADVAVSFRGLDVEATESGAEWEDERMADEVSRLAEQPAGEGGIVLWADNTHVTREGNAMGGYLSRRFGEAYVAVGFTFDDGYYSAYGPALRYEVHRGYPGTHEYVLAIADADVFLLDLAALPSGHALHQILGFRYIGSMPQQFTQFLPHRLAAHFDVVGFVERTEATRYLVEHRF